MKQAARHLLQLGILLLLAGTAYAGWTFWRKASEQPLEKRYQLEEVSVGDVTQSVTANGTLNPVVLVNVGTQVSGTVRTLSADFNSKVKAGQVLLELDPTTFQAAVQQSAGNVASAEASLKLARANEQRMHELFGLEYVSKQELDQAVQAREAAEAQLQTSRGQLMRDRANLGYSRIRSPVSGVVVSRQVDLGQTVAASFQTPTLFQIAQDLSRMQIDSNVAEADIGKLRVGQTARFTVDAFPGQRFEGKVKQIRLNPINQQNVISYDVVVGVDNNALELMPGMTAYVTFIIEQRDDVLLVPNMALRFKPADSARNGRKSGAQRREPGARPLSSRDERAGSTVYLIRDNALVPLQLRTGVSDGKYTEVLGGELKAGDRLVVEDNQPEQKAGGAQTPFRMRSF